MSDTPSRILDGLGMTCTHHGRITGRVPQCPYCYDTMQDRLSEVEQERDAFLDLLSMRADRADEAERALREAEEVIQTLREISNSERMSPESKLGAMSFHTSAYFEGKTERVCCGGGYPDGTSELTVCDDCPDV